MLANLLISSNRFSVDSLRLSVNKIMSSENRNSLTSFFSSLEVLHFSLLVALARTSSTMVSRSGESRCTCLIPDLRGITPDFSP